MGNRITEKSAYTNSIGGTYTNSYTYDFAGRVLSGTDALGHTSSKTYDWLGNLLSETDYSDNAMLYTYDTLGRQLQKQQPFTSNGGTTYYTTSRFQYDLNGNVATHEVSNSKPGETLTWAKTDYAYNSRNKLITVTTYDAGVPENYTQYYYDALGNPLRMYTGLSSPLTITGLDTVSGSDTDYSVTRYAYDRFSNMTSMTDPLNQTETSTYDLIGNLLTKTDRNGNAITYTYDNLGRLTNSSVDSADGEGDASVTVTYTMTGLKRSEANDTASTTYTYDALGRVTQETSGTTAKAYAYNIGGNRTSFTLTQDGTQRFNTTYTYDALNRLTGVTEGTVTAEYGYDTNGNRSCVEYGNGLREEYAYNPANLLTSLVNKNSGNTVLSQYDYTYNLDGNQVSKTDHTGKVTAYAYDGLSRLTGETESISGTTSQSYVYTYDDNNNRAALTAAGTDAYTTAYAYDENNRLLTETKTASDTVNKSNYFYDLNGNQISKVHESTGTGSGSESVALTEGVAGSELSRYNGFNQLMETDAGGVKVSDAYAPSGLRVSKTVDGTTTGYVLDGDQVVLELSGTSVKGKYIRGMNLISSTIGSATNYYLYNGHGDVTELANASGTVTKEYDYDAFGNEKNADPADTNPFRYSGECFDKETNTYYLRARNYDPTTGRFLSEDSVKFSINIMPNGQELLDPLSLNLYTYCHNNPIQYVDPSGHEAVTISATSAAAALALIATATFAFYLASPEGQEAIGQMYSSIANTADDISTYILTFLKKYNLKRGSRTGISLLLNESLKILEMVIEGGLRGVSQLCIFFPERGVLLEPNHHFGITIWTQHIEKEKPILTKLLESYPYLISYNV